MEKLAAKLVDGQMEFKRVGDRVERLRVVRDEVILEGSANCLKVQIQAQVLNLARAEGILAEECRCPRCLFEKEIAFTDKSEALKSIEELKALWKSSTGKDYPEK